MKKRILALALVASMCVSLAACGNSGSKERWYIDNFLIRFTK